MRVDTVEFVDRFVKLSPSLADAYEETIDYWAPETPPLTLLFADLGRKIADNFASEALEPYPEIFDLVEQGMAIDNPELSTAIATGLLEGMISRASQSMGTWHRIRPLLGRLSLSHSDAWIGRAPKVT